MRIKQLETWKEIFDYVVRRDKPVYMLFPEGENMLLANNRIILKYHKVFRTVFLLWYWSMRESNVK